MLRSRKPTGFSIFELLVILAILAMVLGFLIPIIQKANEQAVQAENQQPQAGLLATHIYHDIYNNCRRPRPGRREKGRLFHQHSPAAFCRTATSLAENHERPKGADGSEDQHYTCRKDPSTMDYVRVQNLAANVRSLHR